jgi:Tfp pilus assembly protein PilF
MWTASPAPLAAAEASGKPPAGQARPKGGALSGEMEALAKAYVLWRNGFLLHAAGEFEQAARHFRESIRNRPTAEGHTFLGWSLSKMGRTREAIAECKKAISLDPDYGNPYNDIGVYLTELGRPEEAIPWLRKAMRSRRYCCYQFPHFNLGRIYLNKGRAGEAKQLFRRALEFDPAYAPARKALELIRKEEMTTL